ncbi:unnamed protein product [Arabidopsis thaliana]|jgi:hypothetical protein|uniref:At5g65925 n=3 Tax=Arabidopsis TaxID=3701 RepID=Q6NLB7_ARATH|nr:uncharacterized protein AT5G65925 [Arabidopsis thaliana]AAR20727.1 At5g65925 [Arabidopsis thaliana]AAS92333.1 At5g65925 [Arabidopsis thaliana]AED98124.1 hypothetical protein AT5G65925 [Arabidopsis thaliana]VYS71546.1 unnamed protein product [Arabidopsis thaliana]BAE99390.1 hypothetical protein [Arabidopsis thaliana]|eukprot:NP_680470.2 hypothetical protein AT5G65925 [Arabidopsis thaliana]
MKAKEMKKESNLARLVKSPVRFLIMARDAYIRSMTSCSAGFIRGGGGSGAFGLPPGNFQICEAPTTVLPRSFTLNSATTTRERCRFVTRGASSGEITVETTAMKRQMDLRRNYSCMVMGRIDEEKVCDQFEEEDYSKKRKIGGVFTTHQQ